jgi:hypothetical protein
VEPLTFQVQGSAPEPYLVRFWVEGKNLRSSCTCQAGNRGLACKHRVSLLEGDLTALINGSASAVYDLCSLAAGTDVEGALVTYESQGAPPDIGAIVLPLKPSGRRKSVPVDVACAALVSGGFVKGNTGYFDVYDSAFQYVGSVKVRRGTVFSEQVTEYFPGLPLASSRLKDGLVWEHSQSVYAALPGSSVGCFLTGNGPQESALRNLKRAIVD